MKINPWWIAGGVAALALAGGGAAMVYGTTLGLRNNNPGNLRYNPNIKWRGQIGQEKGMAKFDKPENGIRAMTIDVAGDVFKDGLNTIRKFLNVYAPPSENNTANYIAFVSKRAGIHPDAAITTKDFAKFIPAMIAMENGSQPYPGSLINTGIVAGLSYLGLKG